MGDKEWIDRNTRFLGYCASRVGDFWSCFADFFEYNVKDLDKGDWLGLGPGRWKYIEGHENIGANVDDYENLYVIETIEA